MAEGSLPPQVQDQIQRLQQLNGQLQGVMQQRSQFEMMKAETDRAIETLEGLADDATVYRNVGSLLVKDAGKDAALERLREENETLEVRLKRVQSQEDTLKESLTALQEQIQAALK